MQEIGDLVPAIFKKHVRRGNPCLIEILRPLWPRVAGPAIARRSRPVAFEAGTLRLATDSESWAIELHRMAEAVRAKINSFLGASVVKNLRIERVAELDRPVTSGGKEFPSRTEAAKFKMADGGARVRPEQARGDGRSFSKFVPPGRRGAR